jgi:hypothetical protein
MSNTQTILLDLVIIHVALFLISLIVIFTTKGTTFSKKGIQSVFAFLIPIIGPVIGIYILLSDRMKPPPYDPNADITQREDSKENFDTGMH